MAGTHSVATFRTIGNAATTHTLFTLENGSGSGVSVRVRRLLVQMDATAVLTTFMPLIKTSRATSVSAGTALSKSPFDTAATSAALVVARGANASDGGTATAITATPGIIAWQQYAMRLHTAVGQILAPDNNLLPGLVDQAGVYDFKLAEGEAIMCQIVAAAAGSNPITNYYFVECVWSEV